MQNLVHRPGGYLRQQRMFLLALFILVLALAIVGCTGDGSGNPLPTPKPGEPIGTGARSVAKDTPDGTWQSYLRDMIAEQNTRLASKITLLERYEAPSITQRNLGGLAREISLVDDRTEFNISGNTASTNVDFDVRLLFANGDTDTRTCRFPLSLEFNETDQVWYVLNPKALEIFVVCGN